VFLFVREFNFGKNQDHTLDMKAAWLAHKKSGLHLAHLVSKQDRIEALAIVQSNEHQQETIQSWTRNSEDRKLIVERGKELLVR